MLPSLRNLAKAIAVKFPIQRDHYTFESPSNYWYNISADMLSPHQIA